MPVKLCGETVPVWLSSDESTPIETRPVFDVQYLSARQAIEYQKLLADAQKHSNARQDVDANASIDAAIALAVVSVKNMPPLPPGVETSGNPVLDVIGILSGMEKWELLFKIPSAVLDAEKAKKKSPSTSPSAAASSAPAAPAENAATPAESAAANPQP